MNNKERYLKLVAIYSALAEGKQLQQKINGIWYDRESIEPPDNSILDNWRVKPELKPVDLSVLIESGIDCEMTRSTDESITVITKLDEIYDSHTYLSIENDVYGTCHPRHYHWHSWQGGKCPLPKGFEVEVLLRNGNSMTRNLKSYQWSHTGYDTDIIAFKVIGLEDGYCYPWEREE